MTYTPKPLDPLTLPEKKKGYRHSIDPFLLTDFVVEKKGMKFAADFCAGNGIISVLLAKKYPLLRIRGFEVQWKLAKEAGIVVRANGVDDRVAIICSDLNTAEKMIPSGTFDIVVGNPPYRRAYDGRINPDAEKAIARHELRITLKSFLKAVCHALKERGRISLIYHPYRLRELLETMARCRLAPLRARFVHSFAEKEAQMVLIEGVKNGKNDLKTEAPLFIYKRDNIYSDEVTEMYRSFGCQESGRQQSEHTLG